MSERAPQNAKYPLHRVVHWMSEEDPVFESLCE